MAIMDSLHHATGSLGSANPDEVGLSPGGLSRLTAAFEREVERKRLPGAVALIARHGRVAYFQAFGWRDPAAGAPMQEDTIFRIYSMTKPLVSVAVMMLVEEGRVLLSDPLAHYLPEFAQMGVGVQRNGALQLVAAQRGIALHDLLRHTSGLSYEFTGDGPVQKMYMDAKISRRTQTNAEHAATLARLPLAHQPGEHWEYSRATDVLGRVIEVVTGQTLGAFLKDRITDPLEMLDTAFFVPTAKHNRLAEAFPVDPDAGTPVQLIDVREPALFEFGRWRTGVNRA